MLLTRTWHQHLFRAATKQTEMVPREQVQSIIEATVVIDKSRAPPLFFGLTLTGMCAFQKRVILLPRT